ncbi:hypothetical protein MSAN_01732800 [Mycena sanguinolenta]|uniref:Glycosyltransferase 61 catalytic domain-containing protein n=1 Tax=Mycena sanguinolenta TaxID=230812 RepID=A0A8H6XZX7_9AGAR|nr:hypothetical protein MSAN_01732800 [Mycena sanguinolenta]
MAPTQSRSCCRFSIRNALRHPIAILKVVILTTAVLFFTYLTRSYSASLAFKSPSPYAQYDNFTSTLSDSAVSVPPLSPAKVKTSGWEETVIPSGAHVHGFTVLDNIYLRDGTFYVVTDDPSFPPRNRLLSRPVEMKGGGGGEDPTPTDEQLQFISPDQATSILGDSLTRIEGFSVIVYDVPQFVGHFYHWFGEIILGAWRVYSHILLSSPSSPLPFPRRFILPFISDDKWRDKAGMDGPLMRAAFPDVPIEQAGYWDDLRKLGKTVVFSRVMLVNRSAAHKHPFGGVWYKMIAGAMNVTAPHDFWAPIRASLLRNVLAPGLIPDSTQDPPSLPLVTYISRQGTGRRLLAADHNALVDALKELEVEGLCEVQIAVLERMTLAEQIELVARSLIIVGVHGNGLTHQLWMPPQPRSTMIEIFFPNGYTFDYEIVARNMGHRHYAVWNDTFLTYPEGTTHKGVKYPEGFHGDKIPVYPPTVVSIIRERLS